MILVLLSLYQILLRIVSNVHELVLILVGFHNVICSAELLEDSADRAQE